MKYTKIYILLILVIGFMSSCTYQELMDHEVKPALYFYNKNYGQKDSVARSFFNLKTSIKFDTVYVIVNTMGELSNEDRPIKLAQSSKETANPAIPGTHYIAFDDPSLQKHMIIPAGKNSGKIPVVLTRHPSMLDEEFRLIIEVANNEHFVQGIDKFRTFLIKTTARAVKPTKWDTVWKYYFGSAWGPVKMGFIIDTIGDIDWENNPVYGYASWMKTTVALALIEYNNNHPDDPLKEANNALVTFN